MSIVIIITPPPKKQNPVIKSSVKIPTHQPVTNDDKEAIKHAINILSNMVDDDASESC